MRRDGNNTFLLLNPTKGSLLLRQRALFDKLDGIVSKTNSHRDVVWKDKEVQYV